MTLSEQKQRIVSPLEIGVARLSEAEQIWPIHFAGRVASQTNAELGITAEAVRTFMQPPGHDPVAEWRGKIATQGDDRRVLVARGCNVVQAVVLLELDVAAGGWLSRFYVSERSRGIGSKMVTEALTWFGNRPVSLLVAAYNTPAQAFYAQHGFTDIKAITSAYEIDGIRIPQLKMTRPADLLH